MWTTVVERRPRARGGRLRVTNEKARRAIPLPLLTYNPPGGLRQDPLPAAQSSAGPQPGGIAVYVVDLHEVDESWGATVGGKGANLGGLLRIGGIRVPPGFCVTTDAFRRALPEGLWRLEPAELRAAVERI